MRRRGGAFTLVTQTEAREHPEEPPLGEMPSERRSRLGDLPSAHFGSLTLIDLIRPNGTQHHALIGG